MPANNLRRFSLAEPPAETFSADWLWHGYLMPGDLTLLTSQWKTGKTTLLSGLLRAMGQGGEFIGLPIRAGRALIVSEESPAQWGDRLKLGPIGGHAEVIARPFLGRPTVDDWNELIDDAVGSRRRGQLDLFVVDPLASFLPGRCESDAGTLLEMLQPLHRLAAEGVAVLLLHHPRKKPSEPGASARGSGALLGFVDVVVELTRYSQLKTDRCRRTLTALSRKAETPAHLSFEWDPATGRFAGLGNPTRAQFEDNWAQVKAILKKRRAPATHKELLMDWPADQQPPSPASLYHWLNRAAAEKLVKRQGSGTKSDPWRYRLRNKDDAYYERGELPPMRLIGRGEEEEDGEDD